MIKSFCKSIKVIKIIRLIILWEWQNVAGKLNGMFEKIRNHWKRERERERERIEPETVEKTLNFDIRSVGRSIAKVISQKTSQIKIPTQTWKKRIQNFQKSVWCLFIFATFQINFYLLKNLEPFWQVKKTTHNHTITSNEILDTSGTILFEPYPWFVINHV